MPAVHPRSTNACELCRRRKVKCSGEQPCRSCIKHGWDCVFGRTGRKRYSEAQVKDLLNELQSYKDQLEARSPVANKEPPLHNPTTQLPPASASTSASSVNPRHELSQQLPEQQPPQPRQHSPQQPRSTIPGPGPATGLPHPIDHNDIDAGISPAADLTSGPAFESQVRSLLNIFKPEAHRQSDMRGQGSTSYQWSSMSTLVYGVEDPPIPSLEESQHLLDQFLYYLGVSQHFFDSRYFSDNMIILFQSPEAQEKQRRSFWYIEYLLVMAMAKLMDIEQPTSEPQPPGSELFAGAIKRLPPLHELHSGGVLTVEILTLITIYLQWCDRKHDAYLHIGLAIRLSIALKLNLPENEQSCMPSESTHRLRLWWTVYMLDRRLSSSLGLAAGADERQLRAVFPKHTVGFQSPVAMIINIRIARITDDIMSSLYGNAAVTQFELVRKVQEIIQELHDVGRSFPPPLLLDFSRPLQNVSRTGSSLYLMLLQAIILCTRPMLLRKVRLAAQRQQLSQPPESASDSLTRLCDTCNEAATRSLAILHALSQQGIIPRYGFFDLDATFSAAFVLVMVGFIDSTQDHPPHALVKAFEVLRFLSRSGNLAAEQRFQDIAQSCSHVWPNYVINDEDRGKDTLETEYDVSSRARAYAEMSSQGGIALSHQPDSAPHDASPGEPLDHQYEKRFSDQLKETSLIDGAFDMQGELEIDFTGEAEGIYSSFNHPTLALTGVDYMDWLEIEKVLNAPGA